DDARPGPSRRLLRGEPGGQARTTGRRRRACRRARGRPSAGGGAMSADLLSVERVTKVYARGGLFGRGAFRAVDGVSFALDADRPEIFAIVGESGSGKTTLSRMILNLVAPTAGAIRFRGQDVAHIRGGRARSAFMGA